MRVSKNVFAMSLAERVPVSKPLLKESAEMRTAYAPGHVLPSANIVPAVVGRRCDVTDRLRL